MDEDAPGLSYALARVLAYGLSKFQGDAACSRNSFRARRPHSAQGWDHASRERVSA